RIAELSSTLTEALTGQRIVKAFGREDYEAERFRRRNDEYFGDYMKLTQFIQTQPLVLSVLMSSAIVAIIWLSTREVVVHRLDVGKLMAYWALLVNLINPMNRFAAFVAEISRAVVGAGRVYEILDLSEERGSSGCFAAEKRARRDRLRTRGFRLRKRRRAGAPRPGRRDTRGRDRRAGGSFGRGKDHDRQPGAALLRTAARAHHDRRRRHRAGSSGRLAGGDRHRAAGGAALPRFDRREHPVRAFGSD